MLDSRQKRAAVIGVGRPWYRNPHPSGMDAAQRASVGSAYPVALFALVVVAKKTADSRTLIIGRQNRILVINKQNRLI